MNPWDSQPVASVMWVSLEKVSPNDYNPNAVARNEMKLLYLSILNDGFTQPVVTVYDEVNDKYVIVDGFHRYFVMKTYTDIRERTQGFLPVVVISKNINDRMASTIRHNRARGKHAVSGIASMVFKLLDGGWDDEEICKELGLERDELLRLKHVTGFSKLFENIQYQQAWETQNQIRLKRDYERKNGSNHGDTAVLEKSEEQ